MKCTIGKKYTIVLYGMKRSYCVKCDRRDVFVNTLFCQMFLRLGTAYAVTYQKVVWDAPRYEGFTSSGCRVEL